MINMTVAVYKMCLNLIGQYEKGTGSNPQNKIDVYYAKGRLTDTEYEELCDKLADVEAGKAE